MILVGLDAVGTWDAVIDAEPALAVVLSARALRRGAAGDRELRRPQVAVLARPRARGRRARRRGRRAASALRRARCATLRRAGLVHDFGRLGVSNSIWDKRGPLGAGEWERVRMHPYLTERMLHQSEALAPLGAIAVQHRERLDGSGYPRGLAGAAISRPGADPRRRRRLPGDARAASPPAAALGRRGGRRAAGRGQGRPPRRRGRRGGARRRRPSRVAPPRGARRPDPARGRGAQAARAGLSNKEIAQRLVISPKTVGNHIEHIYAKIGASTRAAASLFAMQHGLLPEERVRRARRRAGAQAFCIACMFLVIAAATARSSSAGLNCTNSLPASRERDVAGRQVEGVAGLEDLLAVGEAEGQPALEHVAPVRALAAVVGQPLEQRRRVDVLRGTTRS